MTPQFDEFAHDAHIRETFELVCSVGSDKIAEFTGNEPAVRSAEILDGVSDVVGPVLNDEGRQIHREFDW